jgi:hypothetical protein
VALLIFHHKLPPSEVLDAPLPRLETLMVLAQSYNDQMKEARGS